MEKVLVLDDCELVKSLGYAVKDDIELVPFCEEIQDVRELAKQVKKKIDEDKPIILIIDLNFGGIHNGLELIRKLRHCDNETKGTGLPIIITSFENESTLYSDPNSIIIKYDDITLISKPYSISDLMNAKISQPITDNEKLQKVYERNYTESGISVRLLDDLSKNQLSEFQTRISNMINESSMNQKISNLMDKFSKNLKMQVTQPSLVTISDLNMDIGNIRRAFRRFINYLKEERIKIPSDLSIALNRNIGILLSFNKTANLTVDNLIVYKENIDETLELLSNLKLRLANMLIEKRMRSMSHSYANENAAMRLLHGACLSSELSLEKYKGALERLKVKPNDVADFIETAKKSDRTDNKGKEASDNSEFFVFIDDEYDKSGWDVVLNTLLNNEGFRVKSFNDYYDNSEAKRFVKEIWDKNRLAGILLDIKWKLDNGKEMDKGLDILPMIKKDFYDVPVIMLTAADESHATKKAIQRGASEYFVKELKSDTDRDYIEYYRSFIKTIKSILEDSDLGERRNIWRKIKMLEGKTKKHILEPLNYAYFFLNVDKENPDVKYVLLSSRISKTETKSTYCESIANSGLVVERIIDEDWQRYYKRRSQSIKESVISLKNDHWCNLKTEVEILMKIHDKRNEAVHEKKGDYESAIYCLSNTVDFVKDWIDNREKNTS